jgi:hypothetical protein
MREYLELVILLLVVMGWEFSTICLDELTIYTLCKDFFEAQIENPSTLCFKLDHIIPDCYSMLWSPGLWNSYHDAKK